VTVAVAVTRPRHYPPSPSEVMRMRIAVIGCGGIGGVLAATLTRAGHDVTPVVGNAQIAAALAEHGYRVRELDGGEWSVKPTHTPLLSLENSELHFDLALVATQAT